jgi:hypothetical protein
MATDEPRTYCPSGSLSGGGVCGSLCEGYCSVYVCFPTYALTPNRRRNRARLTECGRAELPAAASVWSRARAAKPTLLSTGARVRKWRWQPQHQPQARLRGRWSARGAQWLGSARLGSARLGSARLGSACGPLVCTRCPPSAASRAIASSTGSAHPCIAAPSSALLSTSVSALSVQFQPVRRPVLQAQPERRIQRPQRRHLAGSAIPARPVQACDHRRAITAVLGANRGRAFPPAGSRQRRRSLSGEPGLCWKWGNGEHGLSGNGA